MAATYGSRLGLATPASGDRNWDATVGPNFAALDALAPLGALNVAPAEFPSASLNVRVAAGSFVAAGGALVSYAGTSSQACTASTANYLYLTAAGALTVNTTGFPAAGTPYVPLAVVTPDASVISTSVRNGIVDARVTMRPVNASGRTVTATLTLAATDEFVLASSSSAFTATLPSATGIDSKRITVMQGGTGALTVAAASGQTINGASTKVYSAQYEVHAFVALGGAWYIA